MPSDIRSMRISPEEQQCLKRATIVLKQPLSKIIQDAVTDYAHAMGISLRLPRQQPPKKPRTWADAPEREPGSADRRVSITIDPTTGELLGRASEQFGVSEGTFLRGATFRYLADLKQVNKASARYQQLLVPEKYERRT